MSVFPYVYYMVASFRITQDDRKIALYAGAVTSSFTLAEFCMGVFWGRVSDKLGRKPVLIMGLIGTAISMTVFGIASNLPVALIARALGGMLNGNIGVLQTTVAELVTDKKHQPRAFSIMPFVWCLGSIIGPALGGALAQPCDNYPNVFPRDTIFGRYPFLLPNLVCVVILGFGIIIGILFLKETHPEKKYNRDRGLELGKWIVSKFTSSDDVEVRQEGKAGCVDSESFLEQQPPPGYRSTESSPLLTSVKIPPSRPVDGCPSQSQKQKCGFSSAFTRAVLFIILGYGILAYHSVSFDQLMPIFLSTPVSDAEVQLPFKFTGGLALSSKSIGIMLAVQGVYSMVAQLWLFPYLVRRFGTLNVFRFILCVWPALYVAVPYLVLLPTQLQIPGAWAALIAKITVHVIAFPSTMLLLNNASPSPLVLGSINGVAASVASLSRALGPTVTGFLHSKGLEWGYSGLAWWACGIVCIIGAVESFWIPDESKEEDVKSEKPESDPYENSFDDIESAEPFISRDYSGDDLSAHAYEARTPSPAIIDNIVALDLDDDPENPQASPTLPRYL
ncbi:hypothetical protein AJ80_00010 [Polytolypa hystricis UAMH7299]|uniref:Major facilitator superfamily (MFS) profile domain-containing protein n=1 Tax=Polytolypa hystricis (strain UAMH7299) TaxID=1447883 RepID=A0A2B7Z3Y7_POLH7|nr:hypothetical protein AJ80_00010 [Polytolypa hystricis UAMH7299]